MQDACLPLLVRYVHGFERGVARSFYHWKEGSPAEVARWYAMSGLPVSYHFLNSSRRVSLLQVVWFIYDWVLVECTLS